MTMSQLEQILRYGVAAAQMCAAFFIDITGVDFIMFINTTFGGRKFQEFHQIFDAANSSAAIFTNNL